MLKSAASQDSKPPSRRSVGPGYDRGHLWNLAQLGRLQGRQKWTSAPRKLLEILSIVELSACEERVIVY